MNNEILDILQGVKLGTISPEDALLELKKQPFKDIDFAKVDLHRKLRQGAAEVIYGAGKTTASYTVLPEILDCKEFVNADEIARGLSPFNPDSVAIEAGRLMLKRIEELLEKDETFSIETTLATKSYINLVRRAQAKGYVVKVLFFWLNSPELAQLRVSERVANGGHNIPKDVINRRYVAGICNLFNLFMKEVDSWVIFDNSENPRKQIASGGRNAKTVIDEEMSYLKMQSYVK